MSNLLREMRRYIRYDSETGQFFCIRSYGRHRAGARLGAEKTDGYRTIGFQYQVYMESHLAWLFSYGTLPPLYIDHINGKRDDNRIVNLRSVSCTENNHNLSRDKRNTSGVTGVYFFKRDRTWKASIQINGRNIHLGFYKTVDEAAAVRREAERRLGYHEGHGKVPSHGA